MKGLARRYLVHLLAVLGIFAMTLCAAHAKTPDPAQTWPARLWFDRNELASIASGDWKGTLERAVGTASRPDAPLAARQKKWLIESYLALRIEEPGPAPIGDLANRVDEATLAELALLTEYVAQLPLESTVDSRSLAASIRSALLRHAGADAKEVEMRLRLVELRIDDQPAEVVAERLRAAARLADERWGPGHPLAISPLVRLASLPDTVRHPEDDRAVDDAIAAHRVRLSPANPWVLVQELRRLHARVLAGDNSTPLPRLRSLCAELGSFGPTQEGSLCAQTATAAILASEGEAGLDTDTMKQMLAAIAPVDGDAHVTAAALLSRLAVRSLKSNDDAAVGYYDRLTAATTRQYRDVGPEHVGTLRWLTGHYYLDDLDVKTLRMASHCLRADRSSPTPDGFDCQSIAALVAARLGLVELADSLGRDLATRAEESPQLRALAGIPWLTIAMLGASTGAQDRMREGLREARRLYDPAIATNALYATPMRSSVLVLDALCRAFRSLGCADDAAELARLSAGVDLDDPVVEQLQTKLEALARQAGDAAAETDAAADPNEPTFAALPELVSLADTMLAFDNVSAPSGFTAPLRLMSCLGTGVSRVASVWRSCSKAFADLDAFLDDMRMPASQVPERAATTARLYRQLAVTAFRANAPLDTLRLLELGKARGLLHGLQLDRAAPLANRSPATRRLLAALQTDMRRAHERYESAQSTSDAIAMLDAAATELELHTRWHEVAVENGPLRPVVASETAARLQARDVAALVGDGGLYVSFGFLPDADADADADVLHAVIVGRHGVKAIRLDLTRGEAENDVRGLLGELLGPVEASKRAIQVGSPPGTSSVPRDAARRRIRERIIEPLHGAFATADRIAISPDGILTLLPWDALIQPEDPVALGEYSIVPSLLVLQAAARRGAEPSGAVVAIGNPDYRHNAKTMRDLPGTAAELRMLRTSFPTALIRERDRASEPELVALDMAGKLATAPILHFASHGVFDADVPLRSSLVLAGNGTTPETDGWVSAVDVASMRIGAPLVVLSACETALGRVTYAESITGLPVAFQLAGARLVVASLWRVDDAATAALMEAFYAEFATRGRVAPALAAAKAKLREEPRFRHPSMWAAFVLFGVD